MNAFVVRGAKIAVVAGGRRRGRWSLAAVAVAAALAVAAPGALASAQTRIGINGGRPTEWPILSDVLAGQGLTQKGWLDFASQVGENWLPDTKPVALDYPGQLGIVSGPGALTADQSTQLGQALLHELIKLELGKGQPVAVAGLSEGTLVIDRELAYLQSLPENEAPSRELLTFYVFGDMLRGLGQMYLPGVTIPFIGQTFGPVPETRYDTVVVNEEWDGWANPPDRPWNPLAVLNAVMGAVYTVNGSNDHSQTSLDSIDDAVLVSQVKSTLGGTTSTYIVPRSQLPITRPLLQLGVPRAVVDEIDKLLMPLIRAGYSYMTPELGPRIDRGQLTFTPPPPPQLPTTTKQLEASSEPVAISAAKTSTDEPKTTTGEGRHRGQSTSDEADVTSASSPLVASTPTAEDEDGTDPTTTVGGSTVTEAVTNVPSTVGKTDQSGDTTDSPNTVKGSLRGNEKNDQLPRTTPRTKPGKVRESADSDDAPEVRTTVKPSGAADKPGSPDDAGSADKSTSSQGAGAESAA